MKLLSHKWLAMCAMLGLTSGQVFSQQLESTGIMNDVLTQFHNAAGSWTPVITNAATWLFWTLAAISTAWTFGLMVLRRADISEVFAELARFIIFTGFYWWLLSNAVTGMNIAGSILSSLPELGAQAGGLSSTKLGPSAIVDIGFELYDRTLQAISTLEWHQVGTAIAMQLMALAILVVLALVAVNMLLLLAASWVLLYAGVFFLGFGGSRWTSDIALNYYRTIVAVAAQLMAMVLIVAIGKQFISFYYSEISTNMAAQELAVMLVVSVILLHLVNRLPPMISGIASGGGLGAAGAVGNLGAGAAFGAALGAAGLASSAINAVSGSTSLSGVQGLLGGASSIAAAVNSANANSSASSFDGGNLANWDGGLSHSHSDSVSAQGSDEWPLFGTISGATPITGTGDRGSPGFALDPSNGKGSPPTTPVGNGGSQSGSKRARAGSTATATTSSDLSSSGSLPGQQVETAEEVDEEASTRGSETSVDRSYEISAFVERSGSAFD